MTIQLFLIRPYEIERKQYDDDNDLVRILFSIHDQDNSVIESDSLNMLFLIMNTNKFHNFISNIHKKEFIYLELKLTELLVDLVPFENGTYSLMTGCDETMREGDLSKNEELFTSEIQAH